MIKPNCIRHCIPDIVKQWIKLRRLKCYKRWNSRRASAQFYFTTTSLISYKKTFYENARGDIFVSIVTMYRKLRLRKWQHCVIQPKFLLSSPFGKTECNELETNRLWSKYSCYPSPLIYYLCGDFIRFLSSPEPNVCVNTSISTVIIDSLFSRKTSLCI